MTRKDYQLLAQRIKDSSQYFHSTSCHAAFAADLAEDLKQDNPRFNPLKFMDACRPAWIPGSKHEPHWDIEARRFIPES